jgi:predicted NUDIX family NTP pyrophosphohydrolase
MNNLIEKYLGEGAGNFSYVSNMHKERHMTIKGLMKNNGVFKTAKQRWFLLQKQWIEGKQTKRTTLTSTGIKVKAGDYVVQVDAQMVFGGGKNQGHRRIEWFYIVDDIGVREEYKLGFIYKDGGNFSMPNPKKTKLTWQRKEDKKVKQAQQEFAEEDMAKDKAEQDAASKLKQSEWIGKEGERVKDVEVTVMRKNYFETDWGESSITIMQDSNGNQIKHFGKNQLKKGDIKTVAFTVKAHQKEPVNKWNKVPFKVTMVQRIKIQK